MTGLHLAAVTAAAALLEVRLDVGRGRGRACMPAKGFRLMWAQTHVQHTSGSGLIDKTATGSSLREQGPSDTGASVSSSGYWPAGVVAGEARGVGSRGAAATGAPFMGGCLESHCQYHWFTRKHLKPDLAHLPARKRDAIQKHAA
jgi:hypothetical protein